MSEKIYIVRTTAGEEAFFHTWEEAEGFAKSCVQTHNEPQIIEEYSLANRMKIEL